MKVFPFLAITATLGFGSAQTFIDLGTASTYGALAASAITNTGPTVITGDIGTTGSSITGFPPGVFTGGRFVGSAAAAPLADALAAYDAVASIPSAIILVGNLGGRALAPGTYRYSTSAQLTGTLVLAGTGSPNDAWHFLIGSTFITSVGASVIMTGGGLPGNVFWQIGSSATFGVGSQFSGIVLAHISITVNSGASCDGGLFALGGSISLNSGTVIAETPTGPPAVSSSSSSVSDISSSSSSVADSTSSTSSPDSTTTASSDSSSSSSISSSSIADSTSSTSSPVSTTTASSDFSSSSSTSSLEAIITSSTSSSISDLTSSASSIASTNSESSSSSSTSSPDVTITTSFSSSIVDSSSTSTLSLSTSNSDSSTSDSTTATPSSSPSLSSTSSSELSSVTSVSSTFSESSISSVESTSSDIITTSQSSTLSESSASSMSSTSSESSSTSVNSSDSVSSTSSASSSSSESSTSLMSNTLSVSSSSSASVSDSSVPAITPSSTVSNSAISTSYVSSSPLSASSYAGSSFPVSTSSWTSNSVLVSSTSLISDSSSCSSSTAILSSTIPGTPTSLFSRFANSTFASVRTSIPTSNLVYASSLATSPLSQSVQTEGSGLKSSVSVLAYDLYPQASPIGDFAASLLPYAYDVPSSTDSSGKVVPHGPVASTQTLVVAASVTGLHQTSKEIDSAGHSAYNLPASIHLHKIPTTTQGGVGTLTKLSSTHSKSYTSIAFTYPPKALFTPSVCIRYTTTVTVILSSTEVPWKG